MSIIYNFKKGVDDVIKQWRDFFMAGPSYHGSSCTYDGVRYIYWAIQYGTTATTASTTVLYSYDTWLDAWQYLATCTSGNRGIDIEHDPVRNILIIIHGAALTSWQVFNLNTAAITFCNVSCGARALTTITPVLPAAADYGATIVLPNDTDVPDSIDEGVAGICTTTSIVDKLTGKSVGTFTSGLIDSYVEFTSGVLVGQRRRITAVPSSISLTVAAFGSAPTDGDTFIIVTPRGSVVSATANTLSTGETWTLNKYRYQDVIITEGLGVGQRRRIESHTTGGVITLTPAVTGNPRTGNWTTTPDATSKYKIVPSSDFLYYQPGTTSNNIYRIDVVQTTGTAWSTTLGVAPATPGGGGNLMHPREVDPFSLYQIRGNGGNTLYRFDLGLLTYTTITTYWSSETIATGANVCMLHGRRRIFISKEGQKRTYLLNLITGILEPGPSMPYANPGAYCGKRAKYAKTIDGVEYLYFLRPGGQEYFRIPLEWF